MLGKSYKDGDSVVIDDLLPANPSLKIGSQENPWKEIWCTTFYAGSQLPFGDNLDDLGSLTDRYRHLYLGSQLYLANGTTGAISFRNAADNAFDDALWLDATDNPVLNAITGKQIKFAVNAATILGLTATELAGATDAVVALGDLTHRFTDLFLSGHPVLATGTNGALQARNAAGNATNSLLWSDASDNTVLNAITGKVVKLSVNGSAIFNFSSGKIQQLADLAIRNSADSSSNVVFRDAGDVEVAVGNLKVTAAGKTLSVQTGGAAATSGTFVCNGASNVTINTTSIAVKSIVVISLNTVGGTVGAIPKVTTITAGTSFTVAGTASDTSTYNWAIIQTV